MKNTVRGPEYWIPHGEPELHAVRKADTASMRNALEGPTRGSAPPPDSEKSVSYWLCGTNTVARRTV